MSHSRTFLTTSRIRARATALALAATATMATGFLAAPSAMAASNTLTVWTETVGTCTATATINGTQVMGELRDTSADSCWIAVYQDDIATGTTVGFTYPAISGNGATRTTGTFSYDPLVPVMICFGDATRDLSACSALYS